jgi:hypothetical protein
MCFIYVLLNKISTGRDYAALIILSLNITYNDIKGSIRVLI